MKEIHETPVYCGAMKVWRILNVNSGTLYSMEYDTEEQALNGIKAGEVRNNKTVKLWSILDVAGVLDALEDMYDLIDKLSK